MISIAQRRAENIEPLRGPFSRGALAVQQRTSRRAEFPPFRGSRGPSRWDAEGFDGRDGTRDHQTLLSLGARELGERERARGEGEGIVHVFWSGLLHDGGGDALVSGGFAAAVDAGHALFGLYDFEFDAAVLFPGGGV